MKISNLNNTGNINNIDSINSVQAINSIEDIVNKYDYYIIDIYGVIFNGVKILDDAFNAINTIKKHHKKFTFLSNSPRPSHSIKNKLINLSNVKFQNTLQNSNIITSGDFFIKYFLSNYAELFNKPVMLIGANTYHDTITYINSMLLYEGLPQLNIVEDPSVAKYMILLAFNDQRNTNAINKIVKILEEASKYNIYCLCPNPDISSPQDTGRNYTAGFYAQQYNNMGGEVMFFGKPYKEMYFSALEYLYGKDVYNNLSNNHNGDSIDNLKKRTLAIGDSMGNDILGAININIDSLLVGSLSDIEEHNHYNKSNAILPTYLIQNLK